MALKNPTRAGEAVLEVSPEARSARRMQRLSDLAPPLGRKMLGRKRSPPQDKDRLPLPINSDVLAPQVVVALAHHLDGKQPLFNKFNDGYKIQPDRDHISVYISGGARTNEGPPSPSQPEDVRTYFATRRRQVLHIGDQLQIEAFRNRNISRLRRYSLMTTQFLSQKGRELDPDAVVYTADALQDFGQTLSEHSQELLAPLGDEDLGYQIAVIGTVAEYDPTILSDNLSLLRLAQIEQRAREEHWGALYDATLSHPEIGDRLTKLHHGDETDLQTELARMALLRHD